MREKLIDILSQGRDKGNEMCGMQKDGCEKCPYQAPKGCVWGLIADHLIANDVVPVVRCKDCKYCDFFYPVKELDKEPIPAWYCKDKKGDRRPDDFCSYGERRE